MKTKKIPIKSRIKKKNRSSLGQAFHGAVMGYIDNDQGRDLDNVKKFLNENIADTSYLTETSANGFSVLQDIIHFIPKDIKSNVNSRRSLSTEEESQEILPRLQDLEQLAWEKFNPIWELINERLNVEQKTFLATNFNNQGFNLAQTAAYSGNSEICNAVFKFIKEAVQGPDALATIATKLNKAGFNLAQTAANVGNAKICETVFEFIKVAVQDRAALGAIATQVNEADFNLLHQAASTNNLEILELTLNFLREVEIKSGDNNIIPVLVKQECLVGGRKHLPSGNGKKDKDAAAKINRVLNCLRNNFEINKDKPLKGALDILKEIKSEPPQINQVSSNNNQNITNSGGNNSHVVSNNLKNEKRKTLTISADNRDSRNVKSCKPGNFAERELQKIKSNQEHQGNKGR